jgi:hypothetical protein
VHDHRAAIGQDIDVLRLQPNTVRARGPGAQHAEFLRALERAQAEIAALVGHFGARLSGMHMDWKPGRPRKRRNAGEHIVGAADRG